jgi:hypothetical protein
MSENVFLEDDSQLLIYQNHLLLKHTSVPKTPRDWSIPNLGLRFRFLAWDLTSVSCCAAPNEQTAARVRHCLGKFLRRGVFTKELGCAIILRHWVRGSKGSRALLCLGQFDTQFFLVLELGHDKCRRLMCGCLMAFGRYL